MAKGPGRGELSEEAPLGRHAVTEQVSWGRTMASGKVSSGAVVRSGCQGPSSEVIWVREGFKARMNTSDWVLEAMSGFSAGKRYI